MLYCSIPVNYTGYDVLFFFFTSLQFIIHNCAPHLWHVCFGFEMADHKVRIQQLPILYRVREIDNINKAFKKLCFGFCNKLLVSFLHKTSISVWAHWHYLSIYIHDSLPVTAMKKIRYWLPRFGCHENQDSPSPKLFISLPLLSGL